MEIIFLILFIVIIFSILSGNNSFYTKNPSSIPDNEFYSFVQDKNGRQYNVDIEIKNFPQISALNLKGKKHEWYIIGFAKDNKIKHVYSHKGFDNSGVHEISDWLMTSIIEEINPTSIIILHNHPNGVLSASSQDKISARDMNNRLKKYNIELIEFVCARGDFKKYF